MSVYRVTEIIGTSGNELGGRGQTGPGGRGGVPA